jgi:hypothetical protein
MKSEVESKPDGVIKDRLLKALDKKIELFEKEQIETK